jgi:hypothetical protein
MAPDGMMQRFAMSNISIIILKDSVPKPFLSTGRNIK